MIYHRATVSLRYSSNVRRFVRFRKLKSVRTSDPCSTKLISGSVLCIMIFYFQISFFFNKLFYIFLKFQVVWSTNTIYFNRAAHHCWRLKWEYDKILEVCKNKYFSLRSDDHFTGVCARDDCAAAVTCTTKGLHCTRAVTNVYMW
jgi:hypothetical protein